MQNVTNMQTEWENGVNTALATLIIVPVTAMTAQLSYWPPLARSVCT